MPAESRPQSALPIHAKSMATALPDRPPESIMWMPGGVHQIVAMRGGRPLKVRVAVTPDTAIIAQRALDQYLSAGRQRPYFDFDHEGGKACAWPTSFQWRNTPEPGVYASVSWSKDGAEAITGRSYRAFSPAFFVDDARPARVTGAPLNMGGLVNDPAFRAIQPLWAKSPQPHMDKTKQLLAVLSAIKTLQAERGAIAAKADPNDAAALQARDAEIQARFAEAARIEAEIQAASTDPGDEDEASLHVHDATQALKAKDAEIAALKAARDQAEAELKIRRRSEAEAAVQAAVARGALPPQAKELHAKWQESIERDPGNAALLAGLQAANPVLAGRMTPRDPGTGQIQAVTEDIAHAVKAYHAASTPTQRGILFNRDINDRFDREYERVITAANALGTLAGDLVVQRSLVLLKLTFPVLTRISTDFSSENADFNQTVKTRIRVVPAVTDYNTTTGYAPSDATTTDVPVTITAHKAVQIGFNANELASTRRALFDEQVEPIHYALGKNLCDALFGLILAANYTNATTKALASFARADVTAMAKALYDRGVPDMGRTLLLNSAYFEKLQQDATIVNLAAYQRPEVITRYTLPPIAGFDVFQAVNLITTGNLTGFGFTPDAMAMATRVPNDYTQALPGASHGSVGVVTNPDTGMTVSVVQYVDHKLGASFLRMALMYGVAVGQAPSGQRLISA
ncbi:MAG: hypothetical protein KF833_18620 [Verrucomicrobiae bacterium]|nr:hypothetical protein [Verrucomicrobiae bacterium]